MKDRLFAKIIITCMQYNYLCVQVINSLVYLDIHVYMYILGIRYSPLHYKLYQRQVHVWLKWKSYQNGHWRKAWKYECECQFPCFENYTQPIFMWKSDPAARRSAPAEGTPLTSCDLIPSLQHTIMAHSSTLYVGIVLNTHQDNMWQ